MSTPVLQMSLFRVTYVTITSPLTPVTLSEASVALGAAAFVAESRKHAANDAKGQELGWSCILLAVETYGNRRKRLRVCSPLCLQSARPASNPKMFAEIYGHINLSLVRSVARAILGRELVHSYS